MCGILMWLWGLPFHLWGAAKGNIKSWYVWVLLDNPCQQLKRGFWCLVSCFLCVFVFRWSLAPGEIIVSRGEKFSSFSFFLMWVLGFWTWTRAVRLVQQVFQQWRCLLSSRLPFRVVSENSVSLIHTLCFSSSSALPSIVEGPDG